MPGCGSTGYKKVIPTSGYATAVSPIDAPCAIRSASDGPQNKLFMLDPKTRKFKDFLLPLPDVSRRIDFSTDGTVWFSAAAGTSDA